MEDMPPTHPFRSPLRSSTIHAYILVVKMANWIGGFYSIYISVNEIR